MTASCCNGIIGRRQLSRALSDGRKIGADGRYPVGGTVDVANATYKNTISVPLLSACWQIQIGACLLVIGFGVFRLVDRRHPRALARIRPTQLGF
jgi:hypothetical protein